MQEQHSSLSFLAIINGVGSEDAVQEKPDNNKYFSHKKSQQDMNPQ